MSIDASDLIRIGFSLKEAKLYLALLGKGGATAAELTAASALKRPTVYKLLENLQERGLVTASTRESRRFFTPEPPEQLLKYVETQKRNVERLLPDLSDLFMSKSQHHRVRYYDGVAGIRRIHDILLALPHGSNYYYWGSMHSTVEALGEDFVADYTRKRVSKGIWSNAIYPREEAMRNPALRGCPENLRRIRYFNLQSTKSLGQLFLFDHKIAILSGRCDLFGMVLESEDCYSIMKMVFDSMWETAEQE